MVSEQFEQYPCTSCIYGPTGECTLGYTDARTCNSHLSYRKANASYAYYSDGEDTSQLSKWHGWISRYDHYTMDEIAEGYMRKLSYDAMNQVEKDQIRIHQPKTWRRFDADVPKDVLKKMSAEEKYGTIPWIEETRYDYRADSIKNLNVGEEFTLYKYISVYGQELWERYRGGPKYLIRLFTQSQYNLLHKLQKLRSWQIPEVEWTRGKTPIIRIKKRHILRIKEQFPDYEQGIDYTVG